MKLKFVFGLFIIAIFSACNNSSDKVQTFCDTTCVNDTIKFIHEHPEKPYVYISVKDCIPDTAIWSHKKLTNNLKLDFNELAASGLRINKSALACYFNDTSYAWLEFNDCLTGRGYLAKLSFDIKAKRSRYTSALTRFDPKFKIADGIVSYADYVFIYAEDIVTGKTEKLLLHDHELKIDYDKIHETFDSVNITRSRIWAKVKVDNEWQILEKNINLQ